MNKVEFYVLEILGSFFSAIVITASYVLLVLLKVIREACLVLLQNHQVYS